jgi:hypothetical protein
MSLRALITPAGTRHAFKAGAIGANLTGVKNRSRPRLLTRTRAAKRGPVQLDWITR